MCDYKDTLNDISTIDSVSWLPRLDEEWLLVAPFAHIPSLVPRLQRGKKRPGTYCMHMR